MEHRHSIWAPPHLRPRPEGQAPAAASSSGPEAVADGAPKAKSLSSDQGSAIDLSTGVGTHMGLRAFGSGLVALVRSLLRRPLTWLLPAGVGAWGEAVAGFELSMRTIQGEIALGGALMLALWAAAREHERDRDFSNTGASGPPAGCTRPAQLESLTASVLFVFAWMLALKPYAAAGAAPWLLGTIGCTALRLGGWRGLGLGIALALSVAWLGDEKLLSLVDWMHRLDGDHLRPEGATMLYGQWMSALSPVAPWGAAEPGEELQRIARGEYFSPRLWWVMYAMHTIGWAPVALGLAFMGACLAGVAAAMASASCAAESSRDRLRRRLAAALWGLGASTTLLFIAWVQGMTYVPAVPGPLPFTSHVSGWILAITALASTAAWLMSRSVADDRGVLRRSTSRGLLVGGAVAVMALLLTAFGAGLVHGQRGSQTPKNTAERPSVQSQSEEPVPMLPVQVIPPLSDARPIELGAAIKQLMPDIDAVRVPWTHRADSAVQWLDSPLRTWSSGVPDRPNHRRTGVLRLHAQGQVPQVLERHMRPIWWIVLMESFGHLDEGVDTIVLRPSGGTTPTSLESMCFGALFAGCNFEVLPSLREQGIVAELLCEVRDVGEHARLFELRHPERKPTLAVVLDGWSARGRFTEIKLLVGSEAEAPCPPR